MQENIELNKMGNKEKFRKKKIGSDYATNFLRRSDH